MCTHTLYVGGGACARRHTPGLVATGHILRHARSCAVPAQMGLSEPLGIKLAASCPSTPKYLRGCLLRIRTLSCAAAGLLSKSGNFAWTQSYLSHSLNPNSVTCRMWYLTAVPRPRPLQHPGAMARGSPWIKGQKLHLIVLSTVF